MNEKLESAKSKVQAFVTNPHNKEVARMIAETVIIVAISAAVGYGLRKAGDAIDAKFFTKEVPPAVN